MEVRMGMGVWQVINSHGEAFPAESPTLQPRDRKKVFPALGWSGAGPAGDKRDRGQVPPGSHPAQWGAAPAPGGAMIPPGAGRGCQNGGISSRGPKSRCWDTEPALVPWSLPQPESLCTLPGWT